ncbi:helix-turn-helix domain-containing protein [Streptomyces sp. DSM 110735]|uniref:helix-turn-helix domain-containing protein n=1 Tax=Streptomyces sp. DSM 110735 TaxID=2775031 RepID=UPI0018F750E8|nr:helix-turn-helix transcriptional regulator [Streptomyces sp. DSM 110735]MBJ7901874.1 helix-turn-helix domain-containing protein [Streptomyces sp. DSM 110735]
MGDADEIAAFAALLRELKQRSGLSYEALAKRAHMSTSTLHRYCKGDGVPTDYAVLSRFARLCRATPEELVELHRRWVLADAARERGRKPAADTPVEAPVEAPVPDTGPESRADRPEPVPASPAPSASEEPEAPAAPAPRRARKRWIPVAAAVAVVVAVSTALALDPKDWGTTPTANDRPTGTAATATGHPTPATPHPSTSASPAKRPSRTPSPTGPTTTPPTHTTTAPNHPQDHNAVPLTVSTRTYGWDDPQCEAKYLINRPPGQVSPPVMGQDVPGWVKANGAVAADEQRVALTVQGTGDETVVIESMHVVVVDSGAPAAWNAYLGSSGCGGGVETRSFGTNLDAAHPVVVPKAGQRGFPYKVSQSDPEVLYITAGADTHDVRWYVDLQWNSGGRQGTLRISDHGVPFRTTGSHGRPTYEFPVGGTHWYRVGQP